MKSKIKNYELGNDISNLFETNAVFCICDFILHCNNKKTKRATVSLYKTLKKHLLFFVSIDFFYFCIKNLKSKIRQYHYIFHYLKIKEYDKKRH